MSLASALYASIRARLAPTPLVMRLARFDARNAIGAMFTLARCVLARPPLIWNIHRNVVAHFPRFSGVTPSQLNSSKGQFTGIFLLRLRLVPPCWMARL